MLSSNHLLVPFLALVSCCTLSFLSSGCGGSGNRSADGGRELRVLLVPADGGTEEGTRMDFEPLFRAVGRETGRQFSVRVGQSYTAVVQAMANGQVDIAFSGAVTYLLIGWGGLGVFILLGIFLEMLTTGLVTMPLGFFLGGIWAYVGDHGIGIFLVPVGAVLMLIACLRVLMGLAKLRSK
jgi:hypothetical protein